MLQAPSDLIEALKQDDRAWRMLLDAGFFPADYEAHARSWNESMKWLIVQVSELKKQQETVQGEIHELGLAIKNLEKNQVLNSTSSTVKLKKLLEEHLVPEKGQGVVPVDIFCEAIDINNRRWQNAIEGYLSTQKFDLLVPPGYFDRALSIYERYKFTHNMENVGLVNTDKLIREVKPPLQGSLAEEIQTEKEYIRAYANWLLGGVVKCPSEKELKNHKRAITESCMLHQNYTARQIPKKRYETPFIGAQAVKLQLVEKKKALKALQGELDSAKSKSPR